jgi:transcriptional regulator GlxA family with amidase domain
MFMRPYRIEPTELYRPTEHFFARPPAPARAERFPHLSPLTHRVVMFGFPDAQALDIVGPIEVFEFATRWLKQNGLSPASAYSVELVGLEAGAFSVSSGIRMVANRGFRDVAAAETLLVAGGNVDRVARDQAVLAWLRDMAAKVRRLGSTGALILAHAGLLHKKNATTHWDETDELARIGPTIRVQPDAIYVRDGNIYTSAGVTAGIDMALAMVEHDWGQLAALAVAKGLVMFLKRPGGQSQFSGQLAAQFNEGDELRKLQLWMLDHVSQDLSVPRLAARVTMSERNFARRFAETVGVSPAHYVSKIRTETARRKLEQTDLRISEIAEICGFGTPESMRRVFVSQLGVSPSAYRDRFRAG